MSQAGYGPGHTTHVGRHVGKYLGGSNMIWFALCNLRRVLTADVFAQMTRYIRKHSHLVQEDYYCVSISTFTIRCGLVLQLWWTRSVTNEMPLLEATSSANQRQDNLFLFFRLPHIPLVSGILLVNLFIMAKAFYIHARISEGESWHFYLEKSGGTKCGLKTCFLLVKKTLLNSFRASSSWYYYA